MAGIADKEKKNNSRRERYVYKEEIRVVKLVYKPLHLSFSLFSYYAENDARCSCVRYAYKKEAPALKN